MENKENKDLALMHLQDVMNGLRNHQVVINKDGGDCHAWMQKIKIAMSVLEQTPQS